MMQSRRMSLIETITNVALAVVMQIMVFPWFGLHPSLGDWGGFYRNITCARFRAAPVF